MKAPICLFSPTREHTAEHFRYFPRCSHWPNRPSAFALVAEACFSHRGSPPLHRRPSTSSSLFPLAPGRPLVARTQHLHHQKLTRTTQRTSCFHIVHSSPSKGVSPSETLPPPNLIAETERPSIENLQQQVPTSSIFRRIQACTHFKSSIPSSAGVANLLGIRNVTNQSYASPGPIVPIHLGYYSLTQ